MKRLLPALVLCACITSVNAASFDFSASLVTIFADTGGSNWSGALVGDIYSANLQTPSDATDATATVCIADECQYEFSALSPAAFSVILSDSDTTDSGSTGMITIWNEYDIEEEDAQFFSDMGLGGVLPQGTLVDGWLIEDAMLTDGSTVLIGFISTDTTVYTDLAYRDSPSGIGGAAIGVLTLEDGADLLVAGTAVPIPAAVWLFGSALGLLGWMRRQAI